MAKQREKKEKSLRYKISKTLSKTFSRSTSTLPSETHLQDVESGRSKSSSSSNSSSRNKTPQTKSPTPIGSQEEKSVSVTLF